MPIRKVGKPKITIQQEVEETGDGGGALDVLLHLVVGGLLLWFVWNMR